MTTKLLQPLIYDIGAPGRIGVNLPECDVPKVELPAALMREELALPEVGEVQVLRHFVKLSKLNYSIDQGLYPLGSCTMKYNPKINEDAARLPGFAQLHPLTDESGSQGALFLMHELQKWLGEISGFNAVSLAPAAGAQGEFAGILMIRQYHVDRGEGQRDLILVPNSAHGTNPASAVVAGFHVVSLPTNEEGNTDLAALEAAVGDDLAGFMLTQPSTLGIFDTNLSDVIRIVRDAGGIMYGDGANLNALLGKVKLGELGFDVVHSNLHKTFTQPHGGGGPGAGAVMVSERLLPFLPEPHVTRTEDDDGERFSLSTPPQSIGKLGPFQGNFGALVRAYSYIRTLGDVGVSQISEDAVINANYILSRLRCTFDLPQDRHCKHEVVFSAKNLKDRFGVSGKDVCKRLIDYGIHPPTMYFPLPDVVEESLLIEPTETESKETLDQFIEVMKLIASEAEEDPDLLLNAPHNTPNTRLDEALAARRPVLRWRRDD
jgi:glycine dehydrogenase subunit 2